MAERVDRQRKNHSTPLHQSQQPTEEELRQPDHAESSSPVSAGSLPPLTPQTLLHLQRTIGNQAVQRMVAQRQDVVQAPGPGLSQLGIGNLVPSSMDFLRWSMEREAPIVTWLDQHRVDMLLTPQGYSVIRRIREEVPQAADFPTSELVSILRGWASRNRIPIQLPAQPGGEGQRVSPSSLQSAASSGMSLRGTAQVGEQEGSVTVSFSGVTAALQNRTGTQGGSVTVAPGGVSGQVEGGGTTAGVGVSWSGDVSFNVDHGDYHFSASVTPERWELNLTIGSTSMPDFNSISEVFRNGEQALRNAVGGIARARTASDMQSAVSDNLGAIKSAISTASAIQSISAGQFRAQFTLSGSSGGGQVGEPGAGAPQPAGITAGISLQFVF